MGGGEKWVVETERVTKERPEENREEDEEEDEEEERLGRRRTDLRWASMVRHISLLDSFRDEEEKENICLKKFHPTKF